MTNELGTCRKRNTSFIGKPDVGKLAEIRNYLVRYVVWALVKHNVMPLNS